MGKNTYKFNSPKLSSDFTMTPGDMAQSLVKSVGNFVPIFGGPITSLLNDYIPSEVSKRKDDLLVALQHDFQILAEEINEKNLNRPAFISLFMQSFKSAMATEKDEKIECYRAIIANSLIESNPDSDKEVIMLKILDTLSPLHIKFLKVLRDPRKYMADNNQIERARAIMQELGVKAEGLKTFAEVCFPEYEFSLINIIGKDIVNSGLAEQASLTNIDLLSPRLNSFGNNFLEFITFPKDFKREIGDSIT